MVLWLRDHLGPGRHYYFVDACRNTAHRQADPDRGLLPTNPQASGDPSTFILQSTVEGATAAVGGPFPAALLAGLRGRGKAKTWDAKVIDAMFVRYDSLRNYLKGQPLPTSRSPARRPAPTGKAMRFSPSCARFRCPSATSRSTRHCR